MGILHKTDYILHEAGMVSEVFCIAMIMGILP